MRDELILALDVYVREGRNPSRASIEELSGLLRRVPVERELAGNPAFRGPGACRLKISNFVSIDPSADTTGMRRGGRRDKEVWEEFADARERLRHTAAAIRSNLASLEPEEAQVEEDDVAEAPEGRILTRAHRMRERNIRIVTRKKAQVVASTGKLACEACGFDFAAAYGNHGAGFIECHHTVPLHALAPGTSTRLADLALVCANCHRMIHRRARWLSLAELRQFLGASAPAHGPETAFAGGDLPHPDCGE